MIMVGICQWQNPTIDKDDEELQLFNQLTQFNWSQVYFQLFNHSSQFNWSQVYFAINSSVWVKYVCFTQLTVLTLAFKLVEKLEPIWYFWKPEHSDVALQQDRFTQVKVGTLFEAMNDMVANVQKGNTKFYLDF